MGRPTNPHTQAVRIHVGKYLIQANIGYFNVPMILTALSSVLDSLKDPDPSQSISNELQRRERLGMVISQPGDPTGVGRPPKEYRNHSIGMRQYATGWDAFKAGVYHEDSMPMKWKAGWKESKQYSMGLGLI